jgi:hypothetical protein
LAAQSKFNRLGIPTAEINRVARFFLVKHTKTGYIYKMTPNLTKWLNNIPNDHKIYQHFLLQGAPKYIYPHWDFWYEIYHLATQEINRKKVAGFGWVLRD